MLSKDLEPTESLTRLAKHFKDDLASFQKSLEQLQHLKEDHVQACLEQGVEAH